MTTAVSSSKPGPLAVARRRPVSGTRRRALPRAPVPQSAAHAEPSVIGRRGADAVVIGAISAAMIPDRALGHKRPPGQHRNSRSQSQPPQSAAASTIASWSPASSFRSRVSRLPRIGPKRAGDQARQLRDTANTAGADRRRIAEDRQQFGDSGDRCPAAGSLRGAAGTTASCGSSRGRTPAMVRPSAGPPACPCCCARQIDGMPSSASSISLTNSRFPPTSESGRPAGVARRLDDDDLALGPPARAMCPATVVA